MNEFPSTIFLFLLLKKRGKPKLIMKKYTKCSNIFFVRKNELALLFFRKKLISFARSYVILKRGRFYKKHGNEVYLFYGFFFVSS